MQHQSFEDRWSRGILKNLHENSSSPSGDDRRGPMRAEGKNHLNIVVLQTWEKKPRLRERIRINKIAYFNFGVEVKYRLRHFTIRYRLGSHCQHHKIFCTPFLWFALTLTSDKTSFMPLPMGFCEVHHFQALLRQNFVVFRICQID